MKVLRAIAGGTNDAQVLLGMIDTSRLKATDEELIRSLQGNYHPHLVRSLNLLLGTLDFVKYQMKKCEQYIQEILAELLTDGVGKQAVGDRKASVKMNIALM